MSQETWSAVDQYIDETLVQPDKVLEAALRDSRKADLPGIQVSAAQGKLLHVLALAVGARRILEIGTLGGYSAIWMGRALPRGGKLITLEADPRHAAIAQKNLQRAKLSKVVEIRMGLAGQTLAAMVRQKEKPFDLVFIDADKESLAEYFAWAVKLSHPGTLIVADNVVRKGAVVEAYSKDSAVQGVRRMNKLIAREKRVRATTLQTVGTKGYDGLTVAVVV